MYKKQYHINVRIKTNEQKKTSRREEKYTSCKEAYSSKMVKRTYVQFMGEFGKKQ